MLVRRFHDNIRSPSRDEKGLTSGGVQALSFVGALGKTENFLNGRVSVSSLN